MVPLCACGRKSFRRGLCVTCYRKARAGGTILISQQRTRSDVVEDVEWLIKNGEHHPETIACRVGYRSPASLYTALRRAGREDLITQLHR